MKSPLGPSKDLGPIRHPNTQNKTLSKDVRKFKNSKEEKNTKVNTMGVAQNTIVKILNVICTLSILRNKIDMF